MLKARRLRGALVAVLPFAWLLLVLPGCAAVSIPPPPQADPLSAWNSGAAKSAILEFVARVTDASGPDYVAPEERIAVFDNDGTLMVERPTIVQFEFLYRRIRELAPEHPEWTGVEPFRSVLQNDRKALSAMGFAERGRIVAEGQADMYHADFAAAAREFLATARHPRFGARFTDLVYRPMLELIAYLQANRFRVFVVSGGGVEFIRRYSEPVYGVPRENVIGSSMQTELRERDGRLEVYRVPGIGSV
ncbi:MAG: haloacid dehalogenase-like hydrolase, partial [Woeseiaceae bacterium]